MSKHRLTLATLGLLLLSAARVTADQPSPNLTPPMWEYDYQLFAPVELDELFRPADPKTGFYAGASRSYLYWTRPNDVVRQIQTQGVNLPNFTGNFSEGGDWGTGDRLDFGYMAEQGGVSFTLFQSDGPNANYVQRISQINRINTIFNAHLDPANANMFNQAYIDNPAQDRNNPFTNARDFDAHYTINDAHLTSMEANAVWRLDAFHNGGYVEPLVGLRYMKYQDFTRRDSYERRDAMNVPTPLPADPLARRELIFIDQSTWNNHLLAGQIGFRFIQPVGRVTFSTEMKTFAAHNWQEFDRTIDGYNILYGGIGNDQMITTEQRATAKQGGNDTEFVFGADARATAAIQMTRDLSLLTGVEFTTFLQGIARGNSLARNAQESTLVGFHVGLVWNR